MRVPKFSGTILKSAVPVVVGNMLYALLVKFFLLPAGLVTGGTTGLALIAEQLWQIPISGFVFAFNVVMLIIGWLVLGKAFALTTIASDMTGAVMAVVPIAVPVLGGILVVTLGIKAFKKFSK